RVDVPARRLGGARGARTRRAGGAGRRCAPARGCAGRGAGHRAAASAPPRDHAAVARPRARLGPWLLELERPRVPVGGRALGGGTSRVGLGRPRMAPPRPPLPLRPRPLAADLNDRGCYIRIAFDVPLRSPCARACITTWSRTVDDTDVVVTFGSVEAST